MYENLRTILYSVEPIVRQIHWDLSVIVAENSNSDCPKEWEYQPRGVHPGNDEG